MSKYTNRPEVDFGAPARAIDNFERPGRLPPINENENLLRQTQKTQWYKPEVADAPLPTIWQNISHQYWQRVRKWEEGGESKGFSIKLDNSGWTSLNKLCWIQFSMKGPRITRCRFYGRRGEFHLKWIWQSRQLRGIIRRRLPNGA